MPRKHPGVLPSLNPFEKQSDGIALVIDPRPRDLGGFSVRRLLPAAGQPDGRAVHLPRPHGPGGDGAGNGMDVRPHPHIALATVTYLFEGEIIHRDSLGTEQAIHPGDVNWMLAGRGIAHSERSSPEERARGVRLHGIQSWVALPTAHEEDAPRFEHHPAAPSRSSARAAPSSRSSPAPRTARASPVGVLSPTLYVDAQPRGGRAARRWTTTTRSAAVHVVDGAVQIGAAASRLRDDGRAPPGRGGDRRAPRTGAGDARSAARRSTASATSGGTSSPARQERIERAKDDWRNGALRYGARRREGASSRCRSAESPAQPVELHDPVGLPASPSSEKACSQRARPSVPRSQMKRTLTGRPPSTSSP